MDSHVDRMHNDAYGRGYGYGAGWWWIIVLIIIIIIIACVAWGCRKNKDDKPHHRRYKCKDKDSYDSYSRDDSNSRH